MPERDDIQAIEELSGAYGRIAQRLGEVIVGHQQFLDHLLLADDHPAKLLGDESVGFVEFLYGLKVVVFRHGDFSS